MIYEMDPLHIESKNNTAPCYFDHAVYCVVIS